MTTYFVVQGYRFREKYKAEYYADWLTNHGMSVAVELKQVTTKPKDRSKQDEADKQPSQPSTPAES